MKKCHKYSLLACSLPALAVSARAAIIFSSAVNMSGDTDVINTGTLIQATAWNNLSTTINGVTFTGANGTAGVDGGTATTAQTVGRFSTTFQRFTAVGFSTTSTPWNSLSAGYKQLNQGALFTNGAATTTVTIDTSGLTLGQQYQIQLWVADSRGTTRTETATGSNSQVVDFSVPNSAGGLGQYVIGSFTAAGASESFTLTSVGAGSATQLNAMQLYAVPEPSTYGLLGAGALAGLAFVRRRRRA